MSRRRAELGPATTIVMRVILVGNDDDRARLRLGAARTGLTVVAEASTVSEAQGSRVLADAVLTALPHDQNESDFYHEDLTAREHEVLDLLALGLSNKAIAQRLGISDQTVKFHVAALSGKLGASNRTSAVRRAIERGLVTL